MRGLRVKKKSRDEKNDVNLTKENQSSSSNFYHCFI